MCMMSAIWLWNLWANFTGYTNAKFQLSWPFILKILVFEQKVAHLTPSSPTSNSDELLLDTDTLMAYNILCIYYKQTHIERGTQTRSDSVLHSYLFKINIATLNSHPNQGGGISYTIYPKSLNVSLKLIVSDFAMRRQSLQSKRSLIQNMNRSCLL